MGDNLDSSFSGHISSLQEVDENEDSIESEREFKKPSNIKKYDSSTFVPYHEKVLNDLFGKEVADSFLHPVIDTSSGLAGMSATIKSGKTGKMSNKKRVNVSYDQTLAKLTSNAERLWSLLRENSNYHIEREDRKISDELKMSFDSFARSCINRNMTPPQRSFAENSQLTEMARIAKNRKIEKSNLGRRKKQLMFDLSRVQQGNQALLMRDKSFLGKIESDCGVRDMFFPPILPDSPVASSENLEMPLEKPLARRYHDLLEDLDVGVVNEAALFGQAKTPRLPGLRFFTAEDSRRILNEKRERPGLVVGEKDGMMEHLIEKSRRWREDDRVRSGESFGYLEVARRAPKETRPPREESNRAEGPRWQPLTLGALMDFKLTKKPSFLDEDDLNFRQGSVKLWRPRLTRV